jgi:uncharacterized protein
MTTEETVDDGPALTDPEPTTGEHPGGPRHDDAPFPAIAERVADHLEGDPTGHDMHHVWRVFRLGMRICDALESEAADREVVGAAALTHDVHRVRGDGTGVDPEATLGEIRALLAEAGFPAGKVDDVLHCVAVHDEYAFRGETVRADTVEAEVLRDADNLDATGAVGVARTFAFGGAHGTPMWDPDGEAYSQLYHFEDKLLRLREEMHTDPGRAIAEERHAFLERFRERFRAEWHGDA